MEAQGTAVRGWRPPAGERLDVGLHVRVAGSGPPATLLLHGLAGSQRYFGADFDVLARRGRLIAPDLLGFGGSPRPESSDYGPDAHAAAVIGVLERLEVRAPIGIVAHSVGTLVALRIAQQRPDWIQRIIAFGPPPYRRREEARAHIARLGLWVRLFALETPIAHAMCAWMCRHRDLSARIAVWMRRDLPAEIARDAVQHTWHSYSRSLRNLVLGEWALGDLAELSVPVYLVAGEDDPVVDPALLREIAAAHPHVRLEWWPDAGHDLPLTHAERCVERIEALIRRD